VLERFDAARNMARYYVLSVAPTLFVDAGLVREWGRIGRLGGRRVDLYAGSGDARLALSVWLARKIRHGYIARSKNSPTNAS
jgi:predicted DNA-binding WGR domain protein